MNEKIDTVIIFSSLKCFQINVIDEYITNFHIDFRNCQIWYIPRITQNYYVCNWKRRLKRKFLSVKIKYGSIRNFVQLILIIIEPWMQMLNLFTKNELDYWAPQLVWAWRWLTSVDWFNWFAQYISVSSVKLPKLGWSRSSYRTISISARCPIFDGRLKSCSINNGRFRKI